MDLLKKENVKIEKMYGHGGFFKIKEVGLEMMTSALNTQVTLMETAV